MKTDLFDFELPEESIALRPAVPRGSAKLLQVHGCVYSDHIVSDLPHILRAGDILVLNETKVLPVALKAVRAARTHGGGGDVDLDVNLHTHISDTQWLAFIRPAKRVRVGDALCFANGFTGEPGRSEDGNLSANVIDKQDGGQITLEFDRAGEALMRAIAAVGRPPLPPYIARKRETDPRDIEDYQTVFATQDGSVAAPTAGLHFTPELLNALKQAGVKIEILTLHVGAGTFLPVKVTDTDAHIMHSEWRAIGADVAARINQAKREGQRIIAVGTTVLRALESAAIGGVLHAQSGETNIFITPGYEFQIIDGLMTNFHLPRSTLFMLVSALCGLDTMKMAYQYAIDNKYRFYSYGDCSLLWRQ